MLKDSGYCNYRVNYPDKLNQKIEADSQQKLVMRFLLKDGISKKAMRTHQAFVRLFSATDAKDGGKMGREILFVAEPDTSQLYKFDMVGIACSTCSLQLSLSLKFSLLLKPTIVFLKHFSQWGLQP